MADFENMEDITEEVPELITEGDEEDEEGSELQDEEEVEVEEEEAEQDFAQLPPQEIDLQEGGMHAALTEDPMQYLHSSKEVVREDVRQYVEEIAAEMRKSLY